MSMIDELLSNNGSYAASFANARLEGLPLKPAKRLAVVACMDARLDVHKILGLQEGDAHVIRNAGGGGPHDPPPSLGGAQRKTGTPGVRPLPHTAWGGATSPP